MELKEREVYLGEEAKRWFCSVMRSFCGAGHKPKDISVVLYWYPQNGILTITITGARVEAIAEIVPGGWALDQRK